MFGAIFFGQKAFGQGPPRNSTPKGKLYTDLTGLFVTVADKLSTTATQLYSQGSKLFNPKPAL